jgi:hypothetical protein
MPNSIANEVSAGFVSFPRPGYICKVLILKMLRQFLEFQTPRNDSRMTASENGVLALKSVKSSDFFTLFGFSWATPDEGRWSHFRSPCAIRPPLHRPEARQ